MIDQILKKFSFSELNEMQQKMLEVVEKSPDTILLSPTGSGKTLGFLLPLAHLMKTGLAEIQVLITAPSRELAIQIEQVFKQMGTGHKVSCCYGGHTIKTETHTLTEAPAILIGTPGRICYHIRKRNIDLSTVKAVVLDEFDKSLELGYKKDFMYIFDHLPNLEKRILTSATKGGEVPEFVGLNSVTELNYLKDEAVSGLKQKFVVSNQNDKLDALMKLVGVLQNKAMLVFCNHREAVERISEVLDKNGVVHDIFHGKLEQQDRERALIKFRNGTSKVLITTDLASRGLDIPEIEAVVHYQLPPDENAFVHRNGRTARMHAEGVSYVILREDDKLPEYIKQPVEEEKLPEEIVLPEKSEWETIYISCGKKDKVNKIDIVGLLLQKGMLEKEELGKIEVLDFCAFAAVKRKKVQNLVSLLKNEKIKKKQVKIEVAR
ncbi:MAG: DEAD/DEAH box helicase [Opitutaceae bacterium]|nr:DEAD/DEAH box helicase [Cytophagales bacterium]